MTDEELAAVEQTKRDARNYPHNARAVHTHGTQNGHALVSRGNGVFRCVNCQEINEAGYHSSAFSKRCTGRKES